MAGCSRYFQIGFRKCGTTTLWRFFVENGIPAVHFDRGNLARRMRDNIEAGRRVMDGYDERFQAFTDMEFTDPTDFFEGFKCYREIMRDYPDAKFILNTRDRERWLRSMRRWALYKNRQAYLSHRYGTTDLKQVAAALERDLETHHRDVAATVPASRLLVFDIECDPPEKLCRFCGLPDSAVRHYGHENRSPSVFHHFGNRVRTTIPDPVKQRLKRLLRR